HFYLLVPRRHPTATLFPYTTLFRSKKSDILKDITICPGASTLLDAGPGFTAYLWSNGATTQTINASVGNYYVDLSFNGCTYRQRSEEHTSELQSRENLVCRLLLEKK